MSRTRASRVFTISPGTPFLKTLADTLGTGALVDGFQYDHSDPLSLSQATIFVPTRRAARVLRSEFVDMAGGHSVILPTIKPLGELDEDDDFFADESASELLSTVPIGTLDAVLELTSLVLAWRNALPKKFAEFHKDSPLAAPANPADAVWLAKELLDLISTMESEERNWDELDQLVAEDHANWWQLTLEFLQVARRFWPDRLKELHRESPSQFRNRKLRLEAQNVRSGNYRGPVIVAGSTGSLPATAELIDTVARHDSGAIVLPGLDLSMSQDEWDLVGKSGAQQPTQNDPSLRTHPQFGLHLMLQKLGIERGDVEELSQRAENQRNELISFALLPADATHIWGDPARKPSQIQIDRAIEGLELIEASNERQEASAIAIALRLALGDGSQAEGCRQERQAALVTPDRWLARRVKVELKRFGIEADDSGGEALSATTVGGLLKLIAELAFLPINRVLLASLLKHPLTRFGLPEGEAKPAARAFELLVLRGRSQEPVFGKLVSLLAELEHLDQSARHVPLWRERLSDKERMSAHRLAEALDLIFDHWRTEHNPVNGNGRRPLTEWVRKTAGLMEQVCRDEKGEVHFLWDTPAGESMRDLLAGLLESSAELTVSAEEWVAMLQPLLSNQMVKPREGGHPQLHIWGTLEARLQSVDTVILAGLNEGTWPGHMSNDPFLSRAMKSGLGLEPPERRTGLAAHDFQQALGTKNVVLSRSLRTGGAPTIASRWLQRLLTVVGKDGEKALRQRGERYLKWSDELDRGERNAYAIRPEPRPSADLQPSGYSFSEVARLFRDPYAIYVRRILKLYPYDEFKTVPTAAERGTLYHAILRDFAIEIQDLNAADTRDRLDAIINRNFGQLDLPAHVEMIWRHRIDIVADLVLEWERERDDFVDVRLPELSGRASFEAFDLDLYGTADRVDLLKNGTASILDFKTSSTPSARDATSLKDPQLALEAAVLAKGGFLNVGMRSVSGLNYVRLRAESKLRVDVVPSGLKKDEAMLPDDLAHQAVVRLGGLIHLLRTGKRGFASRLVPANRLGYDNEYDHLSRVFEWSFADGSENEG